MMKKYVKPTIISYARIEGIIPIAVGVASLTAAGSAVAGMSAAEAFAAGATAAVLSKMMSRDFSTNKIGALSVQKS